MLRPHDTNTRSVLHGKAAVFSFGTKRQPPLRGRPAQGVRRPGINPTILALLALLSLSATARADTPDGGVTNGGASDEKSREDDIFGGGSSLPFAPTSADGGSEADKKRDEEAFGGTADAGVSTPGNPPPERPGGEGGPLSPVDEAGLFQRLEESNNKLTIGGLAYLRGQYDSKANYALHASPFTAPNLFDIYFDGRPNDDLRVYVRARLVYNPTRGGGATNQLTAFGTLGQQNCTDLCPYLDQAWLKFNAYKKVFFTVGRQHIKWGSGRFWNPTDFLNQQKLNPLDFIDQRLGVNLIKIHVPIESKSYNFYGIVVADGVSRPDQIGYALRAEFVAGPAEITGSAFYQPNQPLKLGADISMGVGDLDWHAEVGIQHPTGKNQILTYGVNDKLDLTVLPPVIPPVHDWDMAWLPQLSIGGEYPIKYSDQDSFILGAEYFYNSYGYPNGNLYPALIFGSVVAPNTPLPQFTPLYNGQHYVAAYVSVPSPGSWNNTSFLGSWIGNLSDKSNVARLDWRQTILTFMQLDVYGSYYWGGSGEFYLSYKLPPNGTVADLLQNSPQSIPSNLLSGAQLLANGVTVRPTVFSVGIGFIINL